MDSGFIGCLDDLHVGSIHIEPAEHKAAIVVIAARGDRIAVDLYFVAGLFHCGSDSGEIVGIAAAGKFIEYASEVSVLRYEVAWRRHVRRGFVDKGNLCHRALAIALGAVVVITEWLGQRPPLRLIVPIRTGVLVHLIGAAGRTYEGDLGGAHGVVSRGGMPPHYGLVWLAPVVQCFARFLHVSSTAMQGLVVPLWLGSQFGLEAALISGSLNPSVLC